MGSISEQPRGRSLQSLPRCSTKFLLDRHRTVVERANGLLVEAERGLEMLGDQFNIMEPRFLAATYSTDSDEVLYLLRLLEDRRLAKAQTLDGGCEILPAGYIKLDELRSPGSASTQGFIAMWFDASLNDAYDSGLQAGVFQAGYDPVRIDRVEHVNRIDDEIIRQINASKFLVADFSGHRGGVYFEAGYALGRSLPISGPAGSKYGRTSFRHSPVQLH